MRNARFAGIAIALASRVAGADPAAGSAADPGPGSAAAPGPTIEQLAAEAEAAAEVIEISDTAPAESASSVHLTTDDLRLRSRTQVSDILRQVPGLMVSQHAGGGKSDQYFIRGFDADHGTDIAIYADGVPVNMPSHGHGQGYADTHFMIPETIKSVDVHKGPYSARFGDFYTAGAMELQTLDKVDGPTLWISGGVPLAGPKAVERYDRRIVGMASPELRADDRTLIAVQIADNDGPFVDAQRFQQGNALLKWQGAVGPGDLELETTWYAARWHASGQLPESAVASGLVDRFGSLDPSEGGNTARASAQAGYSVRDGRGGTWRASAFVLAYQFQLFSNFTLYARDPVRGDEIEQDDARIVWGADAAYDRRFDLAGMDTLLTIGAQSRNDSVDNALWHAADRMRLSDCFGAGANPCNHAHDAIHTVAGYVEANIHVVPHVHVLPGVRLDHFSWGVDDLSTVAARADGTSPATGAVTSTIASPKLSLEVEAGPTLNLFANSGFGFHSNDARGNVASGGSGARARAFGAVVGARTTAIPHLRVAADLWFLRLASELVWSGDEGGTTASDPTRRYGVDVEATYTPLPWLHLDGNLSLAHAELVANAGNGSALALAPRLMGAGGVTVTHGHDFISLRARGIADRPGNDANTLTAQGYVIADLVAGTTVANKLALSLTINNLFDSEWREAQFAETSAITPGAAPIEQIHFTPGIPITATVTAAYTF